MSGRIEARLKSLGIVLPEAPAPVANYVPTHIIGNLLFVSGQIAKDADGRVVTGKLGAGVSIDQGRAAARICALNILAQAQKALGSLDRIQQVAKLTGFVASTSDFIDQPQIVNGASDVLVEILGEAGRHTRSAVGVPALPLNSAVEVEAIIAISGG